VNRNAVPFFGKPPCDARADTARGAGDQYCMFHMHILANMARKRNLEKESGKT